MLAPDHVDEHAEVLADRDERRMLVVQAHSQTAINALRDLGNGTRGGLVDFFRRDQRHSGHERFDALAAVFALFGLFALFEYALGDNFVALGHHLADVGKGNRRQFPQDALEANFGPLRSAPDDLLNSRRNPFISFQPAGIAVVGFVARQGSRARPTSYATNWPATSIFMPAASMSWTCTKTSEPPPSGAIKPYPRSVL
jgi:hypothetical protein